MKKIILSALLGVLISAAGIAVVSGLGFCPCGQACTCSPCNCNK